MSKVRIATVEATGCMYLVQQISFDGPRSKVHCWGEVVSFRNFQTKHNGGKTFMKSAVVISEVEMTNDLVRLLFDQNINQLRSAGHVIGSNKSGTKFTDYGPQG